MIFLCLCRYENEEDFDVADIVDFLAAVKNPKHLSTKRLKDDVEENENRIIYNQGSIGLAVETQVSESHTDNIDAASQHLADGAMNLRVKYLTSKIVGQKKVKKAIAKINAKLAGSNKVFKKKDKKVCVDSTSAFEEG